MNLSFTPSGWSDYIWFAKRDRKLLRRINQLIQDIMRSPFGGIGKPEPLKGDLTVYWSRRINDEHRLVYAVQSTSIVIIACRYRNNHVNSNTERPDILYHYTNIESFKKIIETKTIRATRYDQLNDPGELSLGLKLLRTAVEKYDVEDSHREFKESVLSGIDHFQEATLDVFVLSLSGTANSLDQWRAYVGNGGVAIGFCSKKVHEWLRHGVTEQAGGGVVEGDPLRNWLIKCDYTDLEGHLDLSQQATKLLNLNPLAKHESPQFRQAASVMLPTRIYETICRVKHGAFASEREWRYVRSDLDSIEYPTKLSETNRWYIEMKFDVTSFIKEVWISPNGDVDACERAIRFFKERNGLPFEVKKSRIPYRQEKL